MKRFEFSLDRLLRVKRQLERVAELEQQKAQDAVSQARAVLDGYRDQLTRVSDQFAACVGRTMTPHQWSSAAEVDERAGRARGRARSRFDGTARGRSRRVTPTRHVP